MITQWVRENKQPSSMQPWYSAHRLSLPCRLTCFFFFVAHQRDLISYFDYLYPRVSIWEFSLKMYFIFQHSSHSELVLGCVWLQKPDKSWERRKTFTLTTNGEVATAWSLLFNIFYHTRHRERERRESFVMSLNAKNIFLAILWLFWDWK